MSDLEEIVDEMLDCISKGSDTWGYTGYFAERIEAARKHFVRCRDCKHYTDDEMEYYHYCGNWCEQVNPDGFCKWGERRDA